MKKKIISLGYALIIAFSVICSAYLSSYDVQAAGLAQNVADKLTYYFLTVTGAVDAGVNGVAQVSNSLYNSVREKILNLWGNGIYEDSNGDYVFNEAASQELYEALLNDPNINARVISYFPNTTPYAGMYGTDSAYFHPQVKSFLNSGRSLYNEYLCIVSFYERSNKYCSKAMFIDLSNVAYIVANSTATYRFGIAYYNSSGQVIYPDRSSIIGTYDIATGNFNSATSGTGTAYTSYIDSTDGNLSNGDNFYNNTYFTNSSVSNVTNPYPYLQFPYVLDNMSLCWSNRSIIIGTNSAYGNAEANKQSGTFIVNNYTVIPTVSNTVLNNNNWQRIYNDYTQNVNNESNTYITNETLDPNALRKVMKKYTKVITDAIDQGVDDIENAISTTNEWLKKIYERLGEISAKLDNLGGDSSGGESGGASDCPWTVEDIETISDALYRIDSNLASELTEMQRTYTLLGQILSAINNIEVDGGRDITTIIPILVNLPDSDVLDFIDTGDVLADLMSSVVPFCFVGFALGLCDTLSAQPVTPRWIIPLRVNSSTTGLNVDEEIVIDFADYEQSGFGFIHDLLIAGQCILFILALIWLTFNLLESFNLIFG